MHLHRRVEDSVEGANVTSDFSVEIQVNTVPNTTVLEAVLNTLVSKAINSIQNPKTKRAVT